MQVLISAYHNNVCSDGDEVVLMKEISLVEVNVAIIHHNEQIKSSVVNNIECSNKICLDEPYLEKRS